MSQIYYPELLHSSRVAGAAVTAASATSVLPTESSVTLPGHFIKNVGQVLRLEAAGKVTVAVTTPGTPKWTVKLGSTTVFDGATMTCGTAGYSGYSWDLCIDLTVRAVGASTTTTLIGTGRFTSEILAAGCVTLPARSAPAVGTGVDATSSLAVDLVWTQTAATGSITCEVFRLWAIN